MVWKKDFSNLAFLVPDTCVEKLTHSQKQWRNTEIVNEIQQLKRRSLKHNAAATYLTALFSISVGPCKAVKSKLSNFKKNPTVSSILRN